MAVNQNKIVSAGKADGCYTKRLTAARTSVAPIASPADASDLALIYEAGPNGGFIDQFAYQIVGTGTQAATLLYFWVTDTAGANAEIIPGMIQTISAGAAMSNTVQGQAARMVEAFRNLAAGRDVYASIAVLSSDCECVVEALGGQFEAQ